MVVVMITVMRVGVAVMTCVVMAAVVRMLAAMMAAAVVSPTVMAAAMSAPSGEHLSRRQSQDRNCGQQKTQHFVHGTLES